MKVLESLSKVANWLIGVDQVQAAGPYRGGELDRLTSDWNPAHYSGDSALSDSRDLLTRRLRDLGRNDPAFIALKRALVDHTICAGIGTVAEVYAGNDYVDDFNDESDEEYSHYAEQEIDVEGKLDEGGLQRQVFEEVLENGEALILRCMLDDADRQLPLCYQVLEAEQIDSSIDRSAARGQNAIKQGIEVDEWNRPVAYYLFDAHPSDLYSESSRVGQSSRVPADRVRHIFLPGRPSQTRGASFYTSVMRTLRDMDNYLGDELTAAAIASLFAVVHKTDRFGSGFGFVGDGSGQTVGYDQYSNPVVRLGPGIVSQIPKDDQIESFSANRPNASAEPFIHLIMLLTAMGGNVSPYRLTRDYRGTTYVAARAARLDDAQAFRPLQSYLGRTIAAPIRREWTRYMAAAGKFRTLSPTQLAAQPRRWSRIEVLFPGTEAIDPEKQTDSDIAELAAGTSNFRTIYGRRGKYWRKELRQRAREERYIHDELGLELNFNRPSTPASSSRAQATEGEGET